MDIAFEKAGGRILAFCEIDSYCQKVLHKHWPKIPIFADIHELNREVIRNAGISTAIDIIYGGFPCQPFSVAGNKKGKDDTRYLWPEFSRVVREIRPRWVVGENVPGILSIAADTVCTDLEREGYEVGIWDFEAASVGARHRRERVFFVANAGRTLRQRISEAGNIRETDEERTAVAAQRPDSAHVADPNSERFKEQRQSVKGEPTFAGAERSGGRLIEPEFCGGFDGFSDFLDGSMSMTATGIPNRTNRLKALGNAVVPQQIYPIFKAIMEVEAQKKQETQ